MTREEHIENLKVIASDMPSDKCSDWIESLMAGVKALEQVSSSEKPNKWIPVNEKLPNLSDYNGPKVWQKKVLITGYLSFNDEKNLFVTEAFADDVVHNRVWDTVVVAWMPLPLPYKQEVEG